MEEINFKKPEKIELLFGILAICYSLAICEGYKVEREKGVVFKESKGKPRKAKSLFRTGLTEILRQITSREQLVAYLMEFVSSLVAFETNKKNEYLDGKLKSV